MLNIIQKRKYTYAFSLTLVILSIVLLLTQGLKLGIDFRGGTLMEVQFEPKTVSGSEKQTEAKIPNRDEIKAKLGDLKLNDLIVQSSDNNKFILRYIASDENLNEQVLQKLNEFGDNVKKLRVDFIGASLSASATGIYASSLTKHTDKLLELMSDVLLNPAFKQEELDKIKKQSISGLKAAKEEPSAIAGNVRKVLLYGKDHPYGELETEETVESITVDMCKNYYNTYFHPNIAYLAIVGDIEADDAVVAKYDPEKYILVAVDKDVLNNVAGKHWNYYNSNLYGIEPKWVEVEESYTKRYPHIQTLTGDKTDNIIGLNRIGIKTAEKLITDDMTESEMKEVVFAKYLEKGRTKEDAELNYLLVGMHTCKYKGGKYVLPEFILDLYTKEELDELT